MKECPLYTAGEIVLYTSTLNGYSWKCIILQAQYFGRYDDGVSPRFKYRERYIIKPIDGNHFTHNHTQDGITYTNINRCAGEYLSKCDTIVTIKHIEKHIMI